MVLISRSIAVMLSLSLTLKDEPVVFALSLGVGGEGHTGGVRYMYICSATHGGLRFGELL